MNACIFVLCMSSSLLTEQPAKPVAQDPELRYELLQRFDIDQKVRLELMAWLKEHGHVVDKIDAAKLIPVERQEYERLLAAMKDVDTWNLAWINELVDRQGWPTIALVGQDGAHSAWLLVQHASANRQFQRRCLDLMSDLPKDEMSPANVALLTDRVLLAEGKRQIYGTQCTSDGGHWHALPLEDEEHVDARRADVGLGPLAQYLKEIEKLYGPPPPAHD